jgi:hypothetical protein
VNTAAAAEAGKLGNERGGDYFVVSASLLDLWETVRGGFAGGFVWILGLTPERTFQSSLVRYRRALVSNFMVEQLSCGICSE